MQIKSLRWPRSRYLERGAAEVSREALKRLQWFDHYQTHGRNAALTCRYFGISRQTFYRWKRRYDEENLRTLEDRSHRPHHRRRSRSSGILCVNGSPLGEGMKTPTIFHGLGHVSEAAIS